jgi:hypothetical protein
MSEDYQLLWPGHPNIYNNGSHRDLKIYFSTPDNGVNEETGILLLISGFGANANSKVYKKMRSTFADLYNLVTVQCDYFGHEFMQDSNVITINISREILSGVLNTAEVEQIYRNGFNQHLFVEKGSRYEWGINAKETLRESIENFNDMGIMQAIDNITAVNYVINILKDNNSIFNTKKIILFGQSHGAYLSYLCNALVPNFFSLLIDNSAWLFPSYLTSSRFVFTKVGRMTILSEFKYFVSNLEYDEELYSLKTLYKKFYNQCNIECFHGTSDSLINYMEKQDFCIELENCTFHQISAEKVDGMVFKSTNHGLDADFLKLFAKVMNQQEFEKDSALVLESSQIETKSRIYNVNYKNGLPVLSITNKNSIRSLLY